MHQALCAFGAFQKTQVARKRLLANGAAQHLDLKNVLAVFPSRVCINILFFESSRTLLIADEVHDSDQHAAKARFRFLRSVGKTVQLVSGRAQMVHWQAAHSVT